MILPDCAAERDYRNIPLDRVGINRLSYPIEVLQKASDQGLQATVADVAMICRSVGVEVVIFRGNNRNRRRGFHNTYVFYRELDKLLRV